ncbi:MAG TPA: Hpt domain-containing protein [Labilithrix sp.]|nr:Hpt domain-containing protein [Labilithrix sp.]
MELRESFRAPFLQMAWQRHTRVVELLAREGPSELRSAAGELHCLSGEASMLDFQNVAELARVAEKAARDNDRPLLTKLVSDLREAIKAVEPEGSS